MTQTIIKDHSKIAALLTQLPPGAKIELTKLASGALAVTDQPKTKQQLLQQFAHLANNGISLSDAADKYRVPRHTIRNWVYQGKYVSFKDETAYPKLVNEDEVALCAQIYHQRQNSALDRVPYFDENDCLIEELKHPALSVKRRQKTA